MGILEEFWEQNVGKNGKFWGFMEGFWEFQEFFGIWGRILRNSRNFWDFWEFWDKQRKIGNSLGIFNPIFFSLQFVFNSIFPGFFQRKFWDFSVGISGIP